jgi:signal transduction histidine kinase
MSVVCTPVLRAILTSSRREHRERALRAIYRNAQQQTQLLGELLDAARIDADAFHLEREAWEVVEPAAAAKQIQGSIEIDPEVSATSIHADGARLRQVMANLFSNAVKFTPDGGQVTAQVRQGNGAIEIVVSDTGRGIARDFLPAFARHAPVPGTSTTRPPP